MKGREARRERTTVPPHHPRQRVVWCGQLTRGSASDLLEVEGVEQGLSRAQAVAVGPAQQEEQARQRLELLLQQHLQPRELLPLDQVQTRYLADSCIHRNLLLRSRLASGVIHRSDCGHRELNPVPLGWESHPDHDTILPPLSSSVIQLSGGSPGLVPGSASRY